MALEADGSEITPEQATDIIDAETDGGNGAGMSLDQFWATLDPLDG